jgi:NhaC family Na+:H+ antiporter
MGIAAKMGLDPAITAGAVISGAYFGDKSSPLSDTTNLACAAAGAKLYDHIRETLWTSVPALLAALALFWMLGKPGEFDTSGTLDGINAAFAISPVLFLPLILVLGLAILRWPPFLTIFIGALAGGVIAVIMVPQNVAAFAGDANLPWALQLLKGVWKALATGFVSATGEPAIDLLLSRGGMESMLGTIWLIMAALAFGGVVEKAGILDRFLSPLITAAKSTGALIATVVGAAISTNVLASDQYIAIVLPGRMFKKEFEERNLAPVVLSRAVGDSATVTSPLIPWNSCGAFMAATLGVATIGFVPYCFFNLLNPLMTLILGFTGFRMLRITSDPHGTTRRA